MVLKDEVKNMKEKRKMRKGLVFGLSFVLIAAMFLITVPMNATSAIHTVGPAGSGADYNSIQDAIDAADEGDTIRIWAGTYTENVVVDKQLSLIGNGTANTIIDGGGGGDVLTIQADADYTVVNNLTVQNSGTANSGIRMAGFSSITYDYLQYCDIYNVAINNNGYGIYMTYADYNEIGTSTEGVTFTGNYRNSIKLYWSDNNNFINIDISQITTDFAANHGSAIFFDNYCCGNIIDTITITANNDTTGGSTTYYDGIYFDGSLAGCSGNTITKSEIKNTNNGIKIEGFHSGNIIDKNKIHLNRENGIFLNLAHYNNISHHKPEGSDTWGIHDNNKHGVYINNSRSNTINNSYIYDNNKDNDTVGDGIYLENCYGDVNGNILDKNGIYNSVSGNQRYGIHLYNTTDAWIQFHSEIYNNSYGIYKNKKDGIFLDNCADSGNDFNRIKGNWVHENVENGIHLLDSNGNNILKDSGTGYKNQIYDNGMDGILLEDSDYNTIEWNEINNTASGTQINGIRIKKDSGSGESIWNSIENNSIHNNDDHGIYLDETIFNNVQLNVIVNNNDDNGAVGNGVYLKKSNSNTIGDGNIIDNIWNSVIGNQKYGIYLEELDSNVIGQSNSIGKNKEDGIYLDNKSDGNLIELNSITANYGNGIYLEGDDTDKPKDNTIDENALSNNGGYGVYLKYSGTQYHGNIINNNVILNNEDDAVYLENSDYNNITNNEIGTIYSSLHGIILDTSNHNIIEGNDIADNHFGIYLTGSSNNIIKDNTIEDNDDYGINISDDTSDDNEIDHNDFIDNNGGGTQAYDASGDNYWDNDYTNPELDPDTEGGNYWSDHDESGEGAWDLYHGSNQDDPGFDDVVDKGDPVGGKNPYIIDTSNEINPEDRYPFISRRTS